MRPDLPQGIRRAFRLAGRRAPVEQDVDAEIAFHLEMRAAELAARGMTTDAARAEALRRFGDTHQWSSAMSALDRARTADERRAEWLDDLAQDLRYGARALRRSPLFALLAVLTLALGIGANAAVFGVLKAVLLDALPYADPSRVVRVYGRMLDGSIERVPLSAATVTDIREQTRAFSSLGAFESTLRPSTYIGGDGPRVLRGAWVEPAFFRTLGARPAIGRALIDDDAASDTAYVVVLAHDTWQRLFAGDPRVIGRRLLINNVPRTVVGVMARGFVGPVAGAEFFFPMSLRAAMRDPVYARRQQWLGLVGRLGAGVSIDVARGEVVALVARIARAYPKYVGSFGANVVPVRDDMMGDTRTPLLVLMASAGLVLVIACANLAGALLSRTISRRREFAVRIALGAGRGRLVRQLLTESTMLAAAGGVAGVALAWLALRSLRGLAGDSIPAYAELSMDGGAMFVTMVLTLLTGVAFGLVPALSAGRADQEGALREEGRSASESPRSRRLRGLLVAGQIALCVSLLAGAGLLARSLWAMSTAPLGFEPEGALSVAVELPLKGYSTAAERYRFIEQFEEKVRALPGVVGVAATGQAPTLVQNRNGFLPVGAAGAPDEALSIMLMTEASDDFFRTMGIPLREGRTFGPQETPTSPLSVIISESVARQYWPKGGAIGASIRMTPSPDTPLMTVIGVVGDVRNDPSKGAAQPIQYMSIRQAPWNGPFFVVRARGDALALTRPIQRALAEIDPKLPLHDVMTLRAMLGERLAGRRLPVMLMSAFGALALVLASVGVYAMFAAMTAAREREFGVRVALGSSRAAIARLVLRQGGTWMMLGLVGGAAGVVAVTKVVRGLLYGISPFDPIALGAAVVLLLACGTCALLVPVRRATKVDPISALR